MPGWEKVKLKINDYGAVEHKKAYLKEKMSLKSHERGKIVFQIRQITIQCAASNADVLYRRHIGKREDPGDEETTEKRQALGTRMSLRLHGHALYVEELVFYWVLSTKLLQSSMSVTRLDTKKDEKREKKKAELGICRIKDNQKNGTVGSGSLVRDFIDGQCCLVTTDEVVLPNTELKQLVLEFKKSNSNKVKVVELSKYASDIYRYPSGLVVIALNSNKSTLKTPSIFTHRPFSRGDGVDFTCLSCPIVIDTDPAKPFAVKEFQLKPSHDHKGCAVLSDASSGISCQSLRQFKGTSFCQPHGAVVLNGKKEAVGVLYESDERISPIWFPQRSLGKSYAAVQSGCKRM